MTGELPSQPKATVLVVDDEAAVRRVLVMRLQLSGYRVVCAEDGEQALELFHSESPRLLIRLCFFEMSLANGFKCRICASLPFTGVINSD